MEIIESLRLGADIEQGIQEMNLNKILTHDYTYSFDKDLNKRKRIFLDLDFENRFIIAPALNRNKFAVLQRKGQIVERVAELGTVDVQKAAWVRWDPSVCFDLELGRVCMWDTNEGKKIFSFATEGVADFQVSERESGLMMGMGCDGLVILDFRTGDVQARGSDVRGLAKWSNYSGNHFASAFEDRCRLWDIRRMLSPVFEVGFFDCSEVVKKGKVERRIDAYDLMFFDRRKRRMDEFIIDFSFGLDGGWLFIKTQSGIFRLNLKNTDIEIEKIFSRNCTSPGAILETHLGLVSIQNRIIRRFDTYFSEFQSIKIPQGENLLIEISDEDTWYTLDQTCELRQYSV